MKIYFCASVIGGRRMAYLARKIISELKEMNHVVITEHIGVKDVVRKERLNKSFNTSIFQRDMDWLKNNTEVVIAEVSTPSIGVGYELSYALEILELPVLALYRQDLKKKVSPFVLGNTNRNLTVVEYKHIDEIRAILEKFLIRLRGIPRS